MSTSHEEQEARVLYQALLSGNWRVVKCMPLSWMSDELLERTEREWAVSRETPPYCCNRGEHQGQRIWTGNSPSDALKAAAQALATEGFELEPGIAQALAALD